MIVVDASVFVGTWWSGDTNHTASSTWFSTYLLSTETIIAPVILLAEVGAAIARRTGDKRLGHKAVQELQLVPRLSLVGIDASLGALAAQLAVDISLKGADAMYVALAAQYGVTLITWDREQHQRSRPYITTQRPDGT